MTRTDTSFPTPKAAGDVIKPHADRASSHHDTQADAVDRAREIIQNVGGGEMVAHNRQGQIRYKDTIAPAKDPYPPAG